MSDARHAIDVRIGLGLAAVQLLPAGPIIRSALPDLAQAAHDHPVGDPVVISHLVKGKLQGLHEQNSSTLIDIGNWT